MKTHRVAPDSRAEVTPKAHLLRRRRAPSSCAFIARAYHAISPRRRNKRAPKRVSQGVPTGLGSNLRARTLPNGCVPAAELRRLAPRQRKSNMFSMLPAIVSNEPPGWTRSPCNQLSSMNFKIED